MNYTLVIIKLMTLLQQLAYLEDCRGTEPISETVEVDPTFVFQIETNKEWSANCPMKVLVFREEQLYIVRYCLKLLYQDGKLLRSETSYQNERLLKLVFRKRKYFSLKINPFNGEIKLIFEYFRGKQPKPFSLKMKERILEQLHKVIFDILQIKKFPQEDHQPKSLQTLKQLIKPSAAKSPCHPDICGASQHQELIESLRTNLITQLTYPAPDTLSSLPFLLQRIKYKKSSLETVAITNSKQTTHPQNLSIIFFDDYLHKKVLKATQEMNNTTVTMSMNSLLFEQNVQLLKQKQKVKMLYQFLDTIKASSTCYRFLHSYVSYYELREANLIMWYSCEQEFTLLNYLRFHQDLLSFQIKAKLFLEICNAVNILWCQKNIIYFVKLSKIQLQKNFTITLKDLHNSIHFSQNQQLNNKSLLTKSWKKALLFLFAAYLQIFFDPYHCFRSRNRSLPCSDQLRKQAVYEKLTKHSYMYGQYHVLSCMNALFLEIMDGEVLHRLLDNFQSVIYVLIFTLGC